MASSESERSRLRRMPCSTSFSALAAPSIQSAVTPGRQPLQLRPRSTLRTSCGVPASTSSRSSSSRASARSRLIVFSWPSAPARYRLRGLEELRVIGLAQRGPQHDERILAAGEIRAQIDVQRAAHCALGQPRRQRPVLRLEFRTPRREQRFKLRHRHRAQRMLHRARADRGQQLLRILAQQNQRGMLRRLFQHFEQAVGRLLHERRRSDRS